MSERPLPPLPSWPELVSAVEDVVDSIEGRERWSAPPDSGLLPALRCLLAHMKAFPTAAERMAAIHYQSKACVAVYECGESPPEHSKEPWRHLDAVPEHAIPHRIIAVGRNIAVMCDEDEVAANADRIVACVNALAGVPDPAKLMSMLRTFVDNYEENYSEMNGEGITEFADIQNAMKGND